MLRCGVDQGNAVDRYSVTHTFNGNLGEVFLRRFATSDHKPLTDVWDKNIPGPKYFDELFRVSKRQIIWGCNYYARHIPHQSRIIWDKINDNTPFSQAEIASYSEGVKVYMYRYKWNGMLQADMKNKEKRIHPTQKPMRLYQWILTNYAKPGQRILDTHLGSGSSAIAAHYFGVDFVGCEIDEHYFNLAKQRIDQETRQIALF